MSTKPTPVAGKKEPQSGARTPARNARTTVNINLANTDDGRQPETETEQRPNTAEPNQAHQPEETPKPPIYKEPQRMVIHRGNREATYASPLAATLFARFDPNDTREQPAEHAIFIDGRLRERGYI